MLGPAEGQGWPAEGRRGVVHDHLGGILERVTCKRPKKVDFVANLYISRLSVLRRSLSNNLMFHLSSRLLLEPSDLTGRLGTYSSGWAVSRAEVGWFPGDL